MSARNFATRGSFFCPNQNIACLRRSCSGSERAMRMSTSGAAESSRCDSTKIVWRCMASSCRRSYNAVRSDVLRASLCPAQKSACFRTSTGRAESVTMPNSHAFASGPPCCATPMSTRSCNFFVPNASNWLRRNAWSSCESCWPSTNTACPLTSSLTLRSVTSWRSVWLAPGSSIWPSQNVALAASHGSALDRATRVRPGTPAPSGSCDSTKTACSRRRRSSVVSSAMRCTGALTSLSSTCPAQNSADLRTSIGCERSVASVSNSGVTVMESASATGVTASRATGTSALRASDRKYCTASRSPTAPRSVRPAIARWRLPTSVWMACTAPSCTVRRTRTGPGSQCQFSLMSSLARWERKFNDPSPSPHTPGREANWISTSPEAPRTRSAIVCARAAGGAAAASTAIAVHAARVTRSNRVIGDQVLEKFADARVVPLAQPENGLLAQLDVAVVPRDVDELVRRLSLATLRQREDHLLLERLVGQPIVHRRQIGDRHTALTRPEQRLLADLHVLMRILGDAQQPAAVVRIVALRHRLDHLLL